MSYLKYPRTPHLPWSKGVTSDDRTLETLSGFQGQEIVCTEKRDGECSSLYSDGYIHARSIESASRDWQSWLKRFWQERYYDIPHGWRVCGENLYAAHSIKYTLESYFEAFSIWNGYLCLSWDETLEWLEMLDIKPVPVLYRGAFDEGFLRQLANSLDAETCEGYVIRSAESFTYESFSSHVAKFVRANHVQTDQHWTKSWKPNELQE